MRRWRTTIAQRPRPFIAAAGGLLSLALVGAAWLLFAPQAVGGPFSYVFIQGNSMLPAIRHGDVVLLRRADDYRVGDAVAARHPDLGVVLHRIVEDDGERFTLRGDNRADVDSYRPVRDEMVGRLWLRIPGAAPALNRLRRADVAAGLVGVTLALLVARHLAAARRERVVDRPPRRDRAGPVAALSLQTAGGQNVAGLLAAVLTVAGGLWLLVAVQGDERVRPETLAFEEHGRFEYGGPVAGGVYEGNRLAPPNPVFLDIVRRLPVTFEYDVTARDPRASVTDLRGTSRLLARVHHQTGWSRTIELQPPTPFEGPAAVSAILELPELYALIEHTANRTSLPADAHQLRVIVVIEAGGAIDGVPFQRSHEQAIEFRLSQALMQLDLRSSTLEAAVPGTVLREQIVPRTLDAPVVPLSVDYAQLRSASLWLGAAAAVGLLAVVVATAWFLRLPEAARIRARYGHLVVPVESMPDARSSLRAALGGAPVSAPVEASLVEVAAFEHLARVAEQRGLLVLHLAHERADDYFVMEGGSGYRYTIEHPLDAGDRSNVVELRQPDARAPRRHRDAA